MASLNTLLADQPRHVVLEAMYLASHELTCSTRLDVNSVLQNKALDSNDAKAAIDLAEKIIDWFVATEGKPLDEFDDKDRTALAQKLSGYRLHHLVDRSPDVQVEARRLLEKWAAEAA